MDGELTTIVDKALRLQDELDAAIKELQSKAADTAEYAKRAVTSAERGYGAVHKTVDKLEIVRGLAASLTDQSGSLQSHVQTIVEMLGFIQAVSKKTRLLSLNASIVAAQAGEHGSPFMVIAEEIKELANSVTQATGDIETQMGRIGADNERIRDAIDSTERAVSEGYETSLSAGDLLGDVRVELAAAQKHSRLLRRAADKAGPTRISLRDVMNELNRSLEQAKKTQ